MYRTLPTWKRATKKEKDRAVQTLKRKPVLFSCQCVRCYECGCPDTVQHPYYVVAGKTNLYLEKKYMNYCPSCGKPKISGSGEVYGLEHTPFCEKESEWIPNPYSVLHQVITAKDT